MNDLNTLLPKRPFKQAIVEVEDFMRKQPQLEPEIIHHFSPGLYAREMRLPAGTLLTGKIHKTAHLCTLSGDIEIASEDGSDRFTGYHTFLSKPGVKRIGLAYASTVFTTFHVTEETDIEKLEEVLVVDTYQDYERFLLEPARDDYRQFLIDYGFTAGQVKLWVEDESNQIPMPEGFDNLYKAPSLIEGEGMFATHDIDMDEVIAPARFGWKRTPAGRYINHSHCPNAYFYPLENSDLMLTALYPIEKDTEITIDYRQAGSVNGYKKDAL